MTIGLPKHLKEEVQKSADRNLRSVSSWAGLLFERVAELEQEREAREKESLKKLDPAEALRTLFGDLAAVKKLLPRRAGDAFLSS